MTEIIKSNTFPTNNQTAKADAGKPQLTLVPTEVIESAYGIIKYQNDIEERKSPELIRKTKKKGTSWYVV